MRIEMKRMVRIYMSLLNKYTHGLQQDWIEAYFGATERFWSINEQ